MSNKIKDRVMEACAVSGTGDVTLSNIGTTGYQAFNAVLSDGDTADYTIESIDNNGIPTGQWEVGNGTYHTGGTFTRTTVYESSNGGSLVSFSGSSFRIFSSVSGEYIASLSGGSGTVSTVSVVTANGVSGSVATPTTTPAITITLGAITPS